jgi:transcriptional antiterminator NusG
MNFENEKKDPAVPEPQAGAEEQADDDPVPEPMDAVASGADATEGESPAGESAVVEEPSGESPLEADGTGESPAETGLVDAAVAAPVEAPAKPQEEKRPAAKKTSKKKGQVASKKKEPAARAAVATEETEPESKLPMKWYVIHTYSGHENKVKENILKMVKTSTIKDQFGRLIVPTEEVAEMKKGKKMITTRKFFPSYILIEMHMSEDSWHLVNGIPGVTAFVGTGTKPQPLTEAEVERILGRMDKDRGTIIPEIPFTLGEHIRIKDGPFSDFTGIIDEINTEKGKLKVLVSIFGRETPVELDFLQVEPI